MKRFVLTGCVFLLVVPLLLTACSPGDIIPGGGCQPQYVYDHITDQGEKLFASDHEKTGNNTGKDATFTLTAEKSTTVTVSADAGVNADLGAIVAGVKVQLQVSVSKSVTTSTSISNSTTITIPDGKIGYGDYGVFVQLASGHLYSPNCGVDYGSHVLSHTPKESGWCTWVPPESPAPCESSPPPNPTAAATPSTFGGALLFSDPLTDNRNGWCPPNFSSCHYNNRGFYTSDEGAGGPSYDTFFASSTTFGDFAYQVQMTILNAQSGADGGGILFRATNPIYEGFKYYYYFRVGLDGSYDVYLWNSDARPPQRTLKSGVASNFTAGLNQSNTIGVIAQGSQLDFYINRQLVASVSDSSYMQGAIGVFAYDSGHPSNSSNPPSQVLFKNAAVRTP